jgi:rhodanese-related sulfurtransferase
MTPEHPASSDTDVVSAIAMSAAGTVLVDVREQDEWDAGHAPAAHLVPMSTISDHLDELPKDEQFLVICHSGGRSRRVTDMLLAAGFDAVNVEGGMMAWRDAGGPLTATP